MRPRNEKFFARFSQADSPVFESAAIFMEPVTAPHEQRALLAKRMHDTEHAGNDTAKPDGRCAPPGPTGLAGQAFSLCSRVYLPDVVGDKLLRDDRMHDLLLVIPARTAGQRATCEGQSGSRWRTEVRNSPRSRTLASNPCSAA
jgi:hypothetical protein